MQRMTRREENLQVQLTEANLDFECAVKIMMMHHLTDEYNTLRFKMYAEEQGEPIHPETNPLDRELLPKMPAEEPPSPMTPIKDSPK